MGSACPVYSDDGRLIGYADDSQLAEIIRRNDRHVMLVESLKAIQRSKAARQRLLK